MSKKHRYLEKLGYKDGDGYFPDNAPLKGLSEMNRKRIRKDRKKYGFGGNECWNLDRTAAMWLYEHVLHYRKTARIDQEYYKFNIPVLVENISYNEEYAKWKEKLATHAPDSKEPIECPKHYLSIQEWHTQAECMDICIGYLKDYLIFDTITKPEYHENGTDSREILNAEGKVIEEMQTAFRIYAEIAPAMWW